jgi:hypothetical protein
MNFRGMRAWHSLMRLLLGLDDASQQLTVGQAPEELKAGILLVPRSYQYTSQAPSGDCSTAHA